MKVHELIKMLQKCDKEAEVRIEYDYDGETVQEGLNFVSQTTSFGAGGEDDDFVFVTLAH